LGRCSGRPARGSANFSSAFRILKVKEIIKYKAYQVASSGKILRRALIEQARAAFAAARS
jgi:hypothetical protein